MASLSIPKQTSNLRPQLIHLNADTTWLLSIPQPESSTHKFYHILIDPWLRGGQSDVAKFFSQQWHADASKAQTIAEVEILIQQIEDGAGASKADSEAEPKDRCNINAVVVCHEFTDHMHKETLLEVNPAVPVFATLKAAEIIRSWKHFALVEDIQKFTGAERNWRDTSRPPLPSWLGICRVAYQGSDMLYYHSALMVAFESKTDHEGSNVEAVIYTPHGISPENLDPVARAKPAIKTLALLHGLHDIRIGAQLNLGAHNGLKAQRLLQAKYWIGTHDELKRGGGIVSFFLKRKVLTVKEALEEEIRMNDDLDTNTELKAMDSVKFVDVANGESLILE